MIKGKLHLENCYPLYMFMKALSSLKDDIPLILDSNTNQLIIRFPNNLRTCLIEIIFSNPNDKNSKNLSNLLEKKKENKKIIDIKKSDNYMVSAEDLRDILKVKKNDDKNVHIIFGDPLCLFIEKRTPKLGIIKKTLNYLDEKYEEIAMNTLKNIKYTSTVNISKRLLDDFFYETGVYSGVIIVKIDTKGIHFKEEGVIGNSDIFYGSDILEYHDVVNNSEKGSYSLDNLYLIKPIIDIMGENDIIRFDIKSDHPLKISIDFDTIGAKITYYISARVTEEEFNEED